MAKSIEIREKPGKWVVRAGGAVPGETNRALELVEGALKPVIYFPRADLAMAMLEPTATRTTCPHKGAASYFSIHTKSTVIDDAGWSYETPHDSVAAIADHIAFYPDKVTIEEL
jgi:uncharacterized protein (DUF427 family)